MAAPDDHLLTPFRKLRAMTLPYTAVLYDLDGTIADSAPAITASLAHTIGRLGLPVP